MKKAIAVLLTATLSLGLVACGQSITADTAAPAETTEAVADDASETEEVSEAVEETADAETSADVTKFGFIYIGNDSEAYTANFIAAQTAIDETYGAAVETIAKYDVPEDAGAVQTAAEDLIAAGCKAIFSTSFGFGETIKEIAASNPDVVFCQATCADANEETVLPNYFNYMGAIYEGRYVAGIIGGLKLQALIDDGTVSVDQAKIGYVAAYPYAEPISGYTSFFMGVRSIVPTATMEVMYANSWGDYETEKQLATTMIENGCIIISQHSDTEGPAEACETAAASGKTVFHVSYNQSMVDIAPNTSLGGCRINWNPYELAVADAVINGTDVNSAIQATGATVDGQDAWAGFANNWVAMLDLNNAIIADGTADAVDAAVAAFADGSFTSADVFVGDYTATNPYAADDTIDLSTPFAENSVQSAPAFGYVLDDVITVLN